MAAVRCAASWNMLRIKDSVDGASVAPASPSSARVVDQHLGAAREGGKHRADAERGRADEQQPAPADPVAERAHRDQRASDQEAVDVDDPQELGAGRAQVGAERGQRQVQHGQVHRVEQARQRDHRQPDPLAASGLDRDRRRRCHGDSADRWPRQMARTVAPRPLRDDPLLDARFMCASPAVPRWHRRGDVRVAATSTGIGRDATAARIRRSFLQNSRSTRRSAIGLTFHVSPET
jgi:hypothetical protein